MDDLLEDLSKREKEIEEYFKLLKFIDGSILSRGDGKQFEVSNLLIKTLKGAVFLILYNLVESSMREAISLIHDSISSTRGRYEDLRMGLQKELWRRAKNSRININDLISGTSKEISLNIHSATFDAKNLFSGNITREEIKKLARIYGFKEKSLDSKKTGSGDQLEEIKNNRNDLAHGNKTFSDVGSGNSIADLKLLSDRVVHYIYEIVDNVWECVENKQYQ
jgi:hypothetical protein